MRPSRGRLSAHRAQHRGLFVAAINKTHRESPQFRRASVRVTHFVGGFIFQQIVFSAKFGNEKNLPHSDQSFSF
jgi:hypothetical protein